MSKSTQEEEIYAPLAVPLSYYMMPIEDMPPDDQERARNALVVGNARLKKALEEDKKAARP